MDKGKVVSLEDRIPKLKEQRRRKANRRLIFLLFLFFTLILSVVYFQSPLSHVKIIKFTGNNANSDQELRKITGLNKKTNIWSVEEDKIEDKLKELPEIKSAEVKVHFPNSVSVEIDELRRIAYIANETEFWPVLENGRILENERMTDSPVNGPILFGFTEGDVVKEMIEQLEALPSEVLYSISEIHYSPKDADKYHITLYMNDGFEVIASLRSFSDKMAHYPSIISQLDPNQKGIIDLEVGSYFKAYDAGGAEEDEKEGEG